jgi:hypothetical protein
MRLSRFLSLIIAATAFSLLYVYQQSDIYRLAYTIQKQQVTFQDLLDKNTVLRYNIESNASLIRIGDRISESKNFQMPDNYRLLVLANANTAGTVKHVAGKESLVSRIFGIKRQAEAGIVNR